MNQKFGKPLGKTIICILSILLLSGILVAALFRFLPQNAQADKSDPVPPPEGSFYWIKDSNATITVTNGALVAHFNDHSVDLSNLDWYHITYPEEPNQFHKDKFAVYPNATRIKDCHYYRANVLQDYTTFDEWKDKDFILKVDIWTDGRLNGDDMDSGNVAHGIFMQYYVAKEYRVYNIRTLLTDEQFALITKQATPHIYNYDELTESLLLKMSDLLISDMGTWEEREKAITEDYSWPMRMFPGA